MIKFHQLIAEFVYLINKSDFCDEPRIVETSFFSNEQFAFKIRIIFFPRLLFKSEFIIPRNISIIPINYSATSQSAAGITKNIFHK